jgi:hypothetical protein
MISERKGGRLLLVPFCLTIMPNGLSCALMVKALTAVNLQSMDTVHFFFFFSRWLPNFKRKKKKKIRKEEEERLYPFSLSTNWFLSRGAAKEELFKKRSQRFSFFGAGFFPRHRQHFLHTHTHSYTVYL